MFRILLRFILIVIPFTATLAQNTPTINDATDKLIKRNFTGAIQDFNRILTITPDNVDALCGRAEAKWNLGNYQEALKDVDRVIALDGNNAKAYCIKGDILYSQKDYTNALGLYNIALNKPDAPHEAIVGKSRVYSQTGNIKDAYNLLDEALIKYPSSAELFYARALLNNSQRRYTKAIPDFDKAIALNPDQNTFGLYFNRGFANYNLEEYVNAVSDFDHAVKADPTNATAFNSRGLAYYEQGSFKEAIDDFLKSIEINPNNSVTYYNLGMAYNKLDDIENACLNFHKSCEMRNTNACKMIVLTCPEKIK
jgi:tetratricopeptide (TPR) repeat protein